LEDSKFSSTAQAKYMVLKPHEEKLHHEVTSSTKIGAQPMEETHH